MTSVKLADDQVFVKAICEFANTKFLVGKSIWFYGKYINVYLRNGDRWVNGARIKALTVANVTVTTPGQGVYNDFLLFLETLTSVIYIEGVLEPIQYPMYYRRNYVGIGPEIDEPGLCFYKLLD